MSPHKVDDFVASDSGSSTPALVDALSDSDQSGLLSSPSHEETFKTESQVNEPIAIVGIGECFSRSINCHVLIISQVAGYQARLNPPLTSGVS